jgi:hypothetical protein
MTEKPSSKNRDTEKYLEMYVDDDGGLRDDEKEQGPEVEIEVAD